ncbi:hypothetical protein KX816_07440 [Sphingosinicellaceae bacterium]|nr:hypothetical protein KX816_07440 [Sphingosinicellaceae bacterium]
MKAQEITVLPTYSDKPVTLEEFSRDVERRRVESGITTVPRNSGKRRTASKRALLAAIEAAGGKW